MEESNNDSDWSDNESALKDTANPVFEAAEHENPTAVFDSAALFGDLSEDDQSQDDNDSLIEEDDEEVDESDQQRQRERIVANVEFPELPPVKNEGCPVRLFFAIV